MDLSKLPTNLETITLNEKTNYRLNEISKIKGCFELEIKNQELLTKKLSKYITCFDYIDKILTIFVTIFSGVKEKEYTELISLVFSLISC